MVTFTQSYNYIRPFEGNREGDVAPGDNEFDSPALWDPGREIFSADAQRLFRAAVNQRHPCLGRLLFLN